MTAATPGGACDARPRALAAIAAASELQQVPRVKYLLFVLLAIFIQLNWGLFGVCTRYLQTNARQPIPSIQLSVVVMVVATAGLVVFVAIPAALRAAATAAAAAWRARRAAAQQQQGAVAEVTLSADAGSKGWTTIDLTPATPAGSSSAPATAAAAEAAPPQIERAAARRKLLVSAGVASGIGLLVALQALTLVYASRLIYAFLVQLIFLLTPLVTAVTNRLVLRQPTPRGLWAALAAALGGSALVIAGNYVSAGAGAGGAAARDMAVGLALAVTSMILLAAYLVLLQVSQHVTSGAAVMWANMLVGTVVLAPLALAVEGTDWSWIHALSLFDWGVVFFAGFFINSLNTLWTQAAARVLGAAIISLFICMRLVSSVVGSVVLLREVPTSPLVWAGMGVCVAAMSVFMGVQAWDKKRQERAAAAAAAAAAAEADSPA